MKKEEKIEEVKPAAKKAKSAEPKVTDILEEYFLEDGIEKVRRSHMAGDKLVKEEVSAS